MSLRAIAIRMKSVQNIRKITRSMKLVSASKYSKAERDLQKARPIGEGANHFYRLNKIEPAKENPQKLVFAITSDKGLCGGAHSKICRSVKQIVQQEGPDIKIITVGDKARALLYQKFATKFILCANDIGRKTPTFLDACKLANAVLRTKYKYTSGRIVFNRFKNIVSYTTSEFPMFSENTIMASPRVHAYDIEDQELMQNYIHFSLVCVLYYTIKESNVTEQASRMTAMDAASKNAGEMLEKLNIRFNRGRQAGITKEISEIVSGAESVKQTN